MGRFVVASLLAASLLLASSLADATGDSPAEAKPGPEDKAAYDAAYREGLKRFHEACATAVRSVPRSPRQVPGIRLDVAPDALSFEQGTRDPAWAFAGMPHERMGEAFIASFLDFTFGDADLHPDFGSRTGMTVTMMGFPAVDVRQADGTYLRYRLKTKSPHAGMVSEPVTRDRAFRHVVSVEPLKIAGGRQHWVGGSRIRVVDDEDGEILGEVNAVSFALPPEGVFASELDQRSWARSTTCPAYLDIQSARTRVSLIGIVEPQRPDTPAADPVSAALEAAVANGSLRTATLADLAAWRAASGHPKAKVAPSFVPDDSYVVLKAFIFPAGLYGAHSAQFYVPKGVPLPTGEPGHSTVFDFNTMRCEGPACRAQ